jgi:hypothetical protein
MNGRPFRALWILILGSVMLFFACGQIHTADNNSPWGHIHNDYQSECLGDRIALADSGYLRLEVINHDIHIHHINAYYNCCLEYQVSFLSSHDTITALEDDIGTPCRCDCRFNLESVLLNMNDGTYFVCLVNADGDTVGIDYAIVGGN